jgi:hypothetical protein
LQILQDAIFTVPAQSMAAWSLTGHDTGSCRGTSWSNAISTLEPGSLLGKIFQLWPRAGETIISIVADKCHVIDHNQ